jgi:hypothetical protein
VQIDSMADDEPEQLKYTLKVKVKGQEQVRADGSRNFSGHGKAQYVDVKDGEAQLGDQYVGQFVEGCRQGKGTYTFKKNGDAYEGHYEENKKHDFGMLKYSSQYAEDEEAEGDADAVRPPRGGVYIGNFFEGFRGCRFDADPNEQTSEGTFHYENGDIYMGQWRAGKKHGTGTYTYKRDDTKLEGEWENGKIQSGQWKFPNGTMYSGQFRYNKPFGQGVWVFKNGNQVVGNFVQKDKEPKEDGDAGDADAAANKPDPKVWCYFKHGKVTAVHGGTMFKPRAC